MNYEENLTKKFRASQPIPGRTLPIHENERLMRWTTAELSPGEAEKIARLQSGIARSAPT